ncbi:MoaD/ThiS family protein [Olleya sp. Bg11-27]|uniref:MoaD/ThiS family protein n=1 Tax=Olleya sp. Bg11-27 TaxID=2058135 RepID=UPI000C30A29E|nr:MoaD/ThiS family protein [Olleya sp. Bg11-27]AUC76983.1 molybdopterin synthase sulfur carrier subunit [Olleya sp. Bg11-27]
MIITIKYFGLIAEITNCEKEDILFLDNNISELLEVLYQKYPGLKNKDFQVAQNQELVPLNTLVTDNELALLPPFAGG